MMKRYDIYGDAGSDIFEHENIEGEWVKAEVAQALYDALRATLPYVADSEMEGHLKAYDNARAVLSLADGEE